MTIPKKYFDVLGILPTKDVTKIKKAYRKLAFKYHPDVNPSEKAHLKFIELTEAYEICIGEKIIKSNGSTKTQKTPQQEREERMQRAREFYRQSKINENKKDLAYFNHLTSGFSWKLFKTFSIMSLLFTIIFAIDSWLPTDDEGAKAQRFIYNYSYFTAIINNKEYDFETHQSLFAFNQFSDNIVLKKSKIFKDVRQVKFIDKHNQTSVFEVDNSIYMNRYLIIIVFLLPIITVLYKKNTPAFTIMYLLSAYAIPVALIIVTLTRGVFGLV